MGNIDTQYQDGLGNQVFKKLQVRRVALYGVDRIERAGRGRGRFQRAQRGCGRHGAHVHNFTMLLLLGIVMLVVIIMVVIEENMTMFGRIVVGEVVGRKGMAHGSCSGSWKTSGSDIGIISRC